jgi:hypothetical protein
VRTLLRYQEVGRRLHPVVAGRCEQGVKHRALAVGPGPVEDG